MQLDGDFIFGGGVGGEKIGRESQQIAVNDTFTYASFSFLCGGA